MKRHASPCLAGLAFALLALGSLTAQDDPELNAKLDALSVSNALGGKEIFEVIANSPEILARRVDQKPASDRDPSTPPPPPTPPGKLIMLGESFPLAPELAGQVRGILTRGSTYLGRTKRCPFRANLLLRFPDAERPPVDMVFCFGCGEVQVWREEKFVAFSPFDRGYGELAAFARAAFPDDPYFAGLSEEAFLKLWESQQTNDPPTPHSSSDASSPQ